MEKTKTKIDFLDIAGLVRQYMDLCNELSGKFDEESRSDNTSMPSMEQSVDHAVTEISQQERFSYDELTSKVMKQLKFLKAQQIHT